MKKFLLLYRGPKTPPDASHAGWFVWFQKLGDKVESMGSPITSGMVAKKGGAASESAGSFNGYSIIKAENKEEVITLLQDHPFLAVGSEYSIEIHELER